jgi:hypothetical protein
VTGEPCHHGMGWYTSSTEPNAARCMCCHEVLPLNPHATVEHVEAPVRPGLRVIKGGKS